MAIVDIIPAVYTDDNARNYVVGVNAAYYNQEAAEDVSKLGGPIPPVNFAALPPLPSSVKPRRAYLKNPAGKGRYVICLTPASALYATPGTTLDLEDSNNTPTTYTRKKTKPEDFGRSYG